MKKKVLSIALIAMSLVSFSGLAQNPNARSCNNADGTCVEKMKGEKKIKGEKRNPFEGLNLTEAQKTQLEELNNKRKAAKEAAKAEKKAAKESAKAERRAAMETAKAEGRSQEQKQLMKEAKRANDSIRMEQKRADKLNYLEEVKAIIGPDQYVVFLENYYVNGQGMKGPKMMKDGRPGMAHQKGDRQKDGKKDGKKGQGDRKMKNQNMNQAAL